MCFKWCELYILLLHLEGFTHVGHALQAPYVPFFVRHPIGALIKLLKK